MVIYLTMLIHTGEMMERGLVGHAIGIITGDTMCEDNLCSKCGYKFPRPIEDALRAELDKRKPIPVSERMPEETDWVMLYDNLAQQWMIGMLITLSTHGLQWATVDGYFFHGSNFSRVTHWMPLPEAPDETP